MLTLRPSDERGFADFGWLQARYTFSFANYHDPSHVGFGPLLVVNQDVIGAGRGFGEHGHASMEIVTYVIDGELAHKDSMGNGSVIRPGDVQLMQAGRGVRHSEFNGSATQPTHCIQMWVLPRAEGGEPSYAQAAFPFEERRGTLRVAVSPDGRDGSLRIAQDACLLLGLLDGDETIAHELGAGDAAWLHVARGNLRANGVELGPGDGLAIEDERALSIDAGRNAEFVMWQFGPGAMA